MTLTTPLPRCPRCPHLWDPHVLVESFRVVMAGSPVPGGGYVVCPGREGETCDCWNTWSIDHPELPDDIRADIAAGLAELRAQHPHYGECQACGDPVTAADPCGYLHADCATQGGDQ